MAFLMFIPTRPNRPSIAKKSNCLPVTTSPATTPIKIIGTNDKPEIDCRKENSDSDSADLTESDAGLTESGHLTLTDVDIKDTVSTQLESVDIDHVNSTYKGDLPKDLDLNALQGMLNLSNGTIANDSNTGTINWTFNSGSEAFNFLGEGETLVLKYQIKSTDDSGSDNDSDSHTITVTITGTNDAPKISAISGDVTEDGTTAKEGETLDFKVLEFSKATKRILLSHTRIFEEVKKQEAQAEKNERRKADDAAKESVKKINASVEKTTLGDISSLAELKARMEESAAEAKPKKEAEKAE